MKSEELTNTQKGQIADIRKMFEEKPQKILGLKIGDIVTRRVSAEKYILIRFPASGEMGIVVNVLDHHAQLGNGETDMAESTHTADVIVAVYDDDREMFLEYFMDSAWLEKVEE